MIVVENASDEDAAVDAADAAGVDVAVAAVVVLDGRDE